MSNRRVKGVRTADDLGAKGVHNVDTRPFLKGDPGSRLPQPTAKGLHDGKTLPRLPSVLDIGRQIAVVDKRYTELDEEDTAFVAYKLRETREVTTERHALEHAKLIAAARRDSLIDLALSLPAQTLADAAVMVMLAWHVSSLLKDGNYGEYEDYRSGRSSTHF